MRVMELSSGTEVEGEAQDQRQNGWVGGLMVGLQEQTG